MFYINWIHYYNVSTTTSQKQQWLLNFSDFLKISARAMTIVCGITKIGVSRFQVTRWYIKITVIFFII